MLIFSDINRIFERLTKPNARGVIAVPELVGKSPADMREMDFTQEFILPVGGTFDVPKALGPSPVNFAAGAVIVAMGGDSCPDGQPVNPFLTGTQRFEFQIDYTQGDKLMSGTNGGFALGSVMFGRNNERNMFNGKELYMPPQQNFFVQVKTRLPERLLVQFTYTALVWRFAQ